VLSAAVADIRDHGFDSPGRVQFWIERLREAAEASLVSEGHVIEALRRSLGAVYQRLVDRGEVLRRHPGVSRFTVQKLTPMMRAELDKRIMASANLIKLNRRQAIDRTLQRFEGWSTSIPSGGSGATDKKEVKDDVRKALSQLPFVERRVAIDQGHKLTAAISEVVAAGGGAIAARWNSNWRQVNYDYREEHRERDGKVYLLRSSWAMDRGFVKPGGAGWWEDVTKPGEEPMCRCWATWLYALRDLPSETLTKKGTDALKQAREAA
jgi:hypothetical protein